MTDFLGLTEAVREQRVVATDGTTLTRPLPPGKPHQTGKTPHAPRPAARSSSVEPQRAHYVELRERGEDHPAQKAGNGFVRRITATPALRQQRSTSPVAASLAASPQILQEFRRPIDAGRQQMIARTGTRHVQEMTLGFRQKW